MSRHQNHPSTDGKFVAAQGPLSGIRVLDLTSVVMGPYCTMIWKQLGADVIKVESPEGDVTRDLGPARRQRQSGSFTYINGAKRSIAIDLRSAAGREVCLDIARSCDVFIHSIRPSGIDRLKLTYKDVAAVNPAIVYCSMLGFGRAGRYFDRPAYDDTIQALSGLAMLQAEVSGAPAYVPSVFADKLTGVTAAYAVLAALLHRERSGQGQEIDVPMFETMVSCLLVEHATGSVFEPPLSRPVYLRMVSAHRRPFPTRDGFLSIMVYNDKQWRNFCRIAGKSQWLADAEINSFENRTRNVDKYYEMLSAVISTKTSEEWEELLHIAGIPCARLNTTDELYDDLHLRDAAFFCEVEDQWQDKMRLPRAPVDFYGTPLARPAPAPRLGEQGRQVLSEIGYPDDKIDRLFAAGTLAAFDESPSASQPHAERVGP